MDGTKSNVGQIFYAGNDFIVSFVLLIFKLQVKLGYLGIAGLVNILDWLLFIYVE